jgi:1,4-alpha-glucan branching enzyme
MINIKHHRGDPHVIVTFSLDDPRPVSVVGDFNDWNPLRTPLAKRSNGLRSASIAASEGEEVRFRYLAEGGEFFDDPDAEWLESNGFGETHGVVVGRIPVHVGVR